MFQVLRQRRRADGGSIMELHPVRPARCAKLPPPLQISDRSMNGACVHGSAIPCACFSAITSVAASSTTLKPSSSSSATSKRH